MSYRTIKKALGETNLERKCRWLFGACLLPLIMGSFWWYGSQTDQIVVEQNRFVGEALVDLAMILAHKDILGTSVTKMTNIDPIDAAESSINKKLAELLGERVFDWEVLHPKNAGGIREPTDDYEWELMGKWKKLGATLQEDEDIDALTKSENKPWEGRLDEERIRYLYYQPVFAKEDCITCHGNPSVEVYWPELRKGDLLAVVRVEMDASNTKKDQDNNRAMLMVAAIATVFLAMVALYVVVRYVIVKPLRHLRDVSDSVRSGDVEQRAVIHTGDEFEELGAAFNRMLRQLLRQQDELRSVNDELDNKIDEMAQANMKLFEMNQLKSDFLATVSHELRTPLNSIIGFSDLLSSADEMKDKQRRYADNIQRSGKQLLDMINDILDLAKIESGKMEVRLSNFNIRTIVASQCDMARPLSERKNIDLEYEIAPSLPPMNQDQGKIEQILNNLLSNAIKYSPVGSTIAFRARCDGDQVEFHVQDQGIGIPLAEREQLFEPFYRASNVGKVPGTGLGLAIVKQAVELHGGTIAIQSEEGKGTTFSVSLPSFPPDAA